MQELSGNPRMQRVTKCFSNKRLTDPAEDFRRALAGGGFRPSAGASVAIAVGSRGIAHIAEFVRETVDFLKECGARPFVVPAMGSHGGATAEGQTAVLASLGVTQETVGAPIRASMETVELPNDGLPNRVFMDRLAWEADAVVVINRVKTHTSFHAPNESGLLKMCVVGLGKHNGAKEIHSFGVTGLAKYIRPTAERMLRHSHIALGMAIVENAADETYAVEAVRPAEFAVVDERLLKLSKSLMPSLPIEDMDILLVDEMGKNISGTGLDTNIIGRLMVAGQSEPVSPHVGLLIVEALSEGSHGNAHGMGLADFITRRFRDQIDFPATYENNLTSTFTQRARMPIVAEHAAQAYEWALRASAGVRPETVRAVRIQNTLAPGEAWVSAAVAAELRGRGDIVFSGEERPLFASDGSLTPFGAWRRESQAF